MFYAYLFKSIVHATLLKETGRGANIRNLSQGLLKEIKIPLPPLETQQKIVAELEEDLAAVAGAKRLKTKMEANIRATIGRVWGEKV